MNILNSFRKYSSTIQKNFVNNLPNLLVNILANALVLVVIYYVASFGRDYTTGYIDRTESLNNKILLKTLNTSIHYFILLCAILFVLVNFGFNLNTVLVLLGSAGIAIALSLKDSISNVSSGIMILLLEYYSIGDLIDVNGTVGYVHEFNLLVTTLKYSNGILINIPNNTIVGGILTNYSKNKYVDMYFNIRVSNYDQSLDLKNLCVRIVNLLQEKSTYVTNKNGIKAGISDMSKEGTELIIKVPIESKNFLAAKAEAQDYVRELIKENNINLLDNFYKEQPISK